MHYNGPIVRPPHEAYSVMLEVTVGCTHNSCRFCSFYHGVHFHMSSLSQVEEDLREARRHDSEAKRVWMVGGDPFSMSTNKLKTLAKLIHRYLPKANIATYARVSSTFHKTVEELRELRAMGINDLVIGIESGDDEALKQMNKGYTSADILRECHKLEEAGINYYAIFLGGLAGHGNGTRNAENTAAVLNQLHPSHIYMTSVAVLPDTKLYEDVRNGKFQEAGELERIKETLTLIKLLKNPITIYGQSVANPVSFSARLPEQREKLITELERIIASFNERDEAQLRRYRESLHSV